jgi:hypothetical protein
MVIRNDDAQQRRAAQRRLAKEVHEGTYKPSKIGQASERERLVREVQALKREAFEGTGRFNAKRSEAAVRRDVKTGKSRSVHDLQVMRAAMQRQLGRRYDLDLAGEADDFDWLYYH